MTHRMPKVDVLLPHSSELKPETAKALDAIRPGIRSFMDYLNSPKAREAEALYREHMASGKFRFDLLGKFDWYEPQAENPSVDTKGA